MAREKNDFPPVDEESNEPKQKDSRQGKQDGGYTIYGKNAKPDILQRVRSYCVEGKKYEGKDEYRVFTVSLNKPVTISFTNRDNDGRQVNVSVDYPENQEIEIDMLTLRKLVTKSVQEGPPAMRHDIFDMSGEPTVTPNLIITLIKDRFAPGSRFQFSEKKNVPSLLNV